MAEEVKIKISDYRDFERKLIKNGAVFLDEIKVKDTYFHQPAGRVLKITEDDKGDFLVELKEKNGKFNILKYNRLKNSDNTKKRLERKYGVKCILRKKRRFWEYKGLFLNINIFPDIGSYIIAEGKNIQKNKVASILGIKNPQYITISFDNIKILYNIFGDNLVQDEIIQLDGIYNKGRITGYSFWVMIRNNKDQVVEGKLHLPLDSRNKFLVFEPGFPGDASSRLERLWLKKLIDSNFTVFAVRHSGTYINSKFSPVYISCAEKQKRAKSKGQLFIGLKKHYTLSDWIFEPYIIVTSLKGKYKVYLAGHSFGALACLYALCLMNRERSALLKKIVRYISLAGGIGKVRSENDPILIQWKKYLNMHYKKVRDKINIGNPDKNVRILKSVYNEVHKEVKNLSRDIDFVLLSPWGDTPDSLDELCPVTESLDLIMSAKRGKLIIDKDQKGNIKQGKLAHDLDNLTSDKFLDLIEGKVSKYEGLRFSN